ncbi:MAG: DUF7260 family protein [Halorhabdus sp.]
MVSTKQPTIETAIQCVDEEMDLLETEQTAFRRFRARLAAIPPQQSTGRQLPTPGHDTAAVRHPDSKPLTEVKTAYRETVMAVPHYDREYGDTLRESLAAEFGAELARYLSESQTLGPLAYSALLEESERAKTDRETLRTQIQTERRSLLEMNESLNDLESELHELSNRISAAGTSKTLARIDNRLAALEQQCLDLVNRRQTTIHDRRGQRLAGIEGTSLAQYLYQDMETVTPVLFEATRCLRTLQNQRTRCLTGVDDESADNVGAIP